MIGNYAGVPCNYTSPIDGFSRFGQVIYETGCGDVLCKNGSFINPAVEAAKKADATILAVGLDLTVEAESLDRTDLLLPGYQTQLINQVASESKGPVILVIMSAGGVDVSFAKNHPKIQDSPLEEDSDDIDALLSIEDDETEECGDDELSTTRTDAMFERNSPDSCSNYGSLPGRSGPCFRKSSGSRYNDKKHKRIKRMVKALRGIIPGANRMSTVAVLDEAIRYLKSLRMEVKKLGVRNLKS